MTDFHPTHWWRFYGDKMAVRVTHELGNGYAQVHDDRGRTFFAYPGELTPVEDDPLAPGARSRARLKPLP